MDNPTLDAVWKGLADLTAEASRMTEAESARFAANPVAKLVGLLPFLAGCDEPRRTALAHLAVWVIASRGGARAVFDHQPSDDKDPLARLAPIADFGGGDKKVIELGMRRLALCMLAGYARDRGRDLANGDYNPLNASAWDYSTMLEKLGGRVVERSTDLGQVAEKVPTHTVAEASWLPGIDAALSVEEAVKGYWQS